MKKKIFSLLCAVILLCSMFPPSYADEVEEGPIFDIAETTPAPETIAHVGLYYGDGAMDGVNLENSVGTGYRLGYMDEDRVFQTLGYIGESMVSVVKNENVWYGTYGDYTCYFDNITSSIMIGCWYVLIPAEVSSFEEAQEFINGSEGYFPAWINGEWQIRYGSYADESAAQEAADALGGTAVGTGGYGVTVVRRGTSQLLFQFDGGADYSLALNPGVDDETKAVTWMKKNKYYGIFQFRRIIAGGDLTISNFLPLDDYAECVTSREMSASWPIEALKAQAVCARNFYEQKLADHRHSAQGFDICNTTHCQVYFGMASTNERTAQAAAETSELRIWYQGERAEIFYYGSNGGATEACKNVWTADHPYLIGQIDPYEPTVADRIYHYSWTVTYTAKEIEELLHKAGYKNCAEIVDFQVTARTEMGNVRAITFTDSNGKTYSFYKDNARNFLSLRSLRYSVTSSNTPVTNSYIVNEGDILSSAAGAYVISGDGTVSQVYENLYVITASGVEQLSVSSAPSAASAPTGELVFTITGTGTGHQVGMSQWGAYAMAQQGFTFDQIIKFYFPGVEIY